MEKSRCALLGGGPVAVAAPGHRGGPISPHLEALPGEMPVDAIMPAPPTTVVLRETLATRDGRGRKLSRCALTVRADAETEDAVTMREPGADAATPYGRDVLPGMREGLLLPAGCGMLLAALKLPPMDDGGRETLADAPFTPYREVGAADMGTRVEAALDTEAGTAPCLVDGRREGGAATVAGVAAILGFLMVP